MGEFFEAGGLSIPSDVDLIEFGKRNLAYSMMKFALQETPSEDSQFSQNQIDIGFWTGFLTKTLMEKGKKSEEAIAEVAMYQSEINATLSKGLER